LLALSAVLGLVALNQTNSRGAQLRKLQQEAVLEQRLLGDALQLQSATGQLVYAPQEIVEATPLGAVELKGFGRPVAAFAVGSLVPVGA
jgi:hypothetical protein